MSRQNMVFMDSPSCINIVASWRHMATETWVNIGSGNSITWTNVDL